MAGGCCASEEFPSPELARAFFSAIQNFGQQRYDDSLLAVCSWMLGRPSTDGWTDGWTDVLIALPCVVLSLAASLLHRRTAAVVSVSGLIGFVGIVVPHAVWLLLGARVEVLHREVGPAVLPLRARP